jgi:hypothetical protein
LHGFTVIKLTSLVDPFCDMKVLLVIYRQQRAAKIDIYLNLMKVGDKDLHK